MSTFMGLMAEFPDIRVDRFRSLPGQSNPVACFLSHVHSDHLEGLETYRGPFLYCSAATREILLRLERRYSRLAYANGITEVRQQHYKHLKKLLKPIPLETPTKIELSLGTSIQVTLFDANHCTGAVMFLFENECHAVIYTGDVRAEPWFVNRLSRHPLLVEYSSGLKTIDTIYLDTSFTSPVKFPTKAEGLQDLIRKVALYPNDTVFHFAAWTFGYEEVWIALSKVLRSRIHVENYKYKLYRSLQKTITAEDGVTLTEYAAPEAAILTGYTVGNKYHTGVLTESQTVRLHSCEKGTRCSAMENDNVIRIIPILARKSDGEELCEVGVGGGGHDLDNCAKIAFDDSAIIQHIISAFSQIYPDQVVELKELIATTGQHYVTLESLDADDMEDITLEHLVRAISKTLHYRKSLRQGPVPSYGGSLEKSITFTYSRHSSFEESCHLVGIFRPREVWPCTADETKWVESSSMGYLFGQYCSGTRFRHDDLLKAKFPPQSSVQTSSIREDTPSSEGSQERSQGRNGDEYRASRDRQPSSSKTSSLVRPRSTSTYHSGDGVAQKRVCLDSGSQNKSHPEAIVSSLSDTLDRVDADVEPVDATVEEGGVYWNHELQIWICDACGWEFDIVEGTCEGQDCDVHVLPEVNLRTVGYPVHKSIIRNDDEAIEVPEDEYEEYAEMYGAESEDEDAYELDSFIDNASIPSSQAEHQHTEPEPESFSSSESTAEQSKKAHCPSLRERDFIPCSNGGSKAALSRLNIGTSTDDDMTSNTNGYTKIGGATPGVATSDAGVATDVVPSSVIADSQPTQTHKANGSQAKVFDLQRLATRDSAYADALHDHGWSTGIVSVNDNHSMLEEVL